MSTTVVAAAAVAGLVAMALCVSDTEATARAPRLGATVELLALAAIGFLPPLVLACGASTWTTHAATRGLPTGVCLARGGGSLPLAVALDAVAGVLVARVGLVAARTARASRRAELRGVGLEHAARFVLPTGEVAYVVRSDRPVAYAGGLARPRAVTTTGLLALLEPVEQEAVVRHEVAHLRLGHPRIALVGSVIAEAYWWLPPARTAWARLRRELEAAADDEVVAALGPGPLMTALAKVALAQAARSPSAAEPGGDGTVPTAGTHGLCGLLSATGELEDLRYRIRRLNEPRSPRKSAPFVLGALGFVMLLGLSSTLCAAFHAGIGWEGLGSCALAFGALGGRPACGGRGRRRAGAAAAP